MSAPPAILYTIGYEGAKPEEFVRALQQAGIHTLVDVRAIPWSRKPGFSKAPLEKILKDHHIEYLHLEALGNPAKRAPKGLSTVGDYKEVYNAHLDTEVAQKALKAAAVLAASKSCCLMCFERDPEQCHRLLTAARLKHDHGFGVQHLYADKHQDQPSLFD